MLTKHNAYILTNILIIISSHVTISSTGLNLPSLTLNDIQKGIHTRHFLIGIGIPSSQHVLRSIARLYRNESVTVGLWNSNVFNIVPWETEVSTIDKQMSTLAFFQRKKVDRKCLIRPVQSVKAIPISGNEDSVGDVMRFLNEKCFLFVNINDTVEDAEYRRRRILKRLYKVPPPNVNKHPVVCERIPPPKTSTEFMRNFLYRSKPVIIENAFNNWEALRKWSNDFLRKQYGDKKVHIKLTPRGEFEGCDQAEKFDNYDTFRVPDFVKDQLLFPDLVVVRPAVGDMKFNEFLDLVEKEGGGSANISAYLEYSSIRDYFPELENDLKELSFVKGVLKLSHLNMWLSNGHTLGKLHFDPYDNFLCQLRGNKKFSIFEPHNNYNLYEAHIQEALLGFDRNTQKFRNAKLLDSTSMVMSPIDILKPDYARFPNFTRANVMECFLNEGDALFLPSFWWHEVQSYPSKVDHRNLAVNFWYEPFLTKDFPCVDCKLDVNSVYRKLLENIS